MQRYAENGTNQKIIKNSGYFGISIDQKIIIPPIYENIKSSIIGVFLLYIGETKTETDEIAQTFYFYDTIFPQIKKYTNIE